MPVGECARGMICLEILFQPCEFGGKPGASGRAAARLRRALNIERNQVPCAQVVRVPGSSGFNANVAPSSFSRSCFSLLCERATTVWPIAAASPTVKGLLNTYRAFGRMHVIWSQPRITAIREPRCDKSRLLRMRHHTPATASEAAEVLKLAQYRSTPNKQGSSERGRTESR